MKSTQRVRALSSLDARVDPGYLCRVACEARLDAVVVNDSVADLAGTVRRARTEGLGVVLNLPLFFDHDLLTRMPDAYATTSQGRRAIDGWLHMACPRSEQFWQARLQAMDHALQAAAPDLVVLDFARTFVMWERVRPDTDPDEIEHGCYCERCRTDPRADRNARARSSTKAVTARVADASRLVRHRAPTARVGIKIVPWLSTDYDGARGWACGQDLAALGRWVDLVMPMSFSSLIDRPTRFLHSLHREVRNATGRPLMPWLQAADPRDPDALDLARFAEMLAAVERDGDAGYGVFHLDGIAGRPDILTLLAVANYHRSEIRE